MRIHLKNFRCHLDNTFDIPDEGLVALSGPNGSGKSTIFAAISYGLYGKIPGKIKKPYSHGKTTSSVELEYMEMNISRSAHPKRLLVNYKEQEYEGDAAQSIIGDVLGMTYDEFLCAVYVVQRSNTSVLSLTASKQIEFVQTLANSTASKYKEEAKERIKSINSEIVGIQGELKVLHTQKEEKEALYPEIPVVPVEIKKGLNPDQVRKKIKELETKSQRQQTELEKIRANLEKVRADERKRADTEDKIKKVTIEIDQLIHIRDHGPEIASEDQIVELNQEIDDYKSTIEYHRRLITYLKGKEALNSAVEEYQQATEAKIEELKSEVVDDLQIEVMTKEVEDAENGMREYDRKKAKFDMETTLKEEARQALAEKFRAIRKLLGVPTTIKTSTGMIECLDKTRVEREKELASIKKRGKKKMCCPACSAFVVLSDEGNGLEVADDDLEVGEETEGEIEAAQASLSIIEEYIKEVKETAKSLNVKIEPLGELPPDPIILHKALLKAKRIKSEYETLQLRELPPVIQRMQNNVEEASLEFDLDQELKEISEYTAMVEELNGEVQLKISEKDRIYQLQSEFELRQQEIESKEKALKRLQSLIPSSETKITSKELESSVAELTQKVSDITLEIGVQRKILDKVRDYEDYQNVMLEIEKISEKIVDVETKHTALERMLEGTYGLEETEKEAEILAMEGTVNSINEHARLYLDQMFSDPMMVRLECVKDKGKKGLKLQLNTTIDYKGDTYEDVEELSGGERQRCDIAFLLAVNDMLGGKLLILDECLNELDASTNTEILSLVRDMCGENKLILVVSHEAVRGLFNTEVMIGS